MRGGVILTAFGAELVNAKGEITVDSPAVRTMLEYCQKLVKFFPVDTVSYDDASNNRALISGRSRDLLQSAARRLLRLERSWADAKIFDAIAGRGRYLAFCALLRTADERVERAWLRVMAEAARTGGDPRPSPGIAPSVSDHRLDRELRTIARASLSAIE